MNALDQQDFIVLYLALDMLGRYAETELARASSAAKRMAMLTMRQRVAGVRAKLAKIERGRHQSAAGSPFYIALGRRIEQLRKRQQFTLGELAVRLGVSPQAFYAYEIGDRRVSAVLSRTLRVPVETLLGLAPAPKERLRRVSPAQRRYIDDLRKLQRRDRLAVMRITLALSRL
jgi:transcriptional regulator with XRE-family HTH domain